MSLVVFIPAVMEGRDVSARDYRIVGLHFLAFLGLLLAVWAWPSGGFALVVTDPRSGGAENMKIISDAEGTFVSGTNVPWMTVAYSDDSNFPARLMRTGAWLVLNHRLAAGCIRE